MKFSISIPTVLTGFIALLFLLPIVIGLTSVFLPAFGYLPTLGYNSFSLSAWEHLFNTPGLIHMIGLSFWVGIISILLSLLLALAIVSSMWGNKRWSQVAKWLSPIMAMPHVALAFGFAFLVTPSGLFGRLIAPLAGWEYPPDWQTINDPKALSLITLLVLKETPFLIFMLMGAVERLPVRATLKVAQSLGYQPWMSWIKLLWPQLYPMVRMPLYTVLAFSISVVDVALILGPDSPPVFSVQLLQWYQDPDLASQLPAAAGSFMLVGLVLLAMALLKGLEQMVKWLGNSWITLGARGHQGKLWSQLSIMGWRTLLVLVTGASFCLLLWSFVWRWRFPSLWPDELTLRSWQQAWSYLSEPLSNSLIIGLAASLLAVSITVLLLELITKTSARLAKFVVKMMYIPMLLPQISFLFGVQIALLKFGLDGTVGSIIFIHLLFVLPYCFLSLIGPWHHFDNRQMTQALLLSHSKIRAYCLIKMPMLWRPLVASFALGFAVSIAQYLPTLFVGAGRVSTITTEAVSLVSGGNRRLIGVYGLLQMLLPVLVYGLAMLSAHWSLVNFRKRLVA